MGILGDILRGKDTDDTKYNVKIIEENVDKIEENNVSLQFNMSWFNRVLIHQGYVPSDDKEKISKILKALQRRSGQCPCGGNGSQFRCPCQIMREQGICKCGLFKTLPDRKISCNTTAKISNNR